MPVKAKMLIKVIWVFKAIMLTSKIQLANRKTKSLRATIPVEVVEALGLSESDVIAWELDKKRACVRRLE